MQVRAKLKSGWVLHVIASYIHDGTPILLYLIHKNAMKVDLEEKQIMGRIGNAVHAVEPDAEVYLFGSRARGDHKVVSDWDVLILLDEDPVKNSTEDRIREPLYDIELETGQLISVFVYPKTFWQSDLKHSPLYENIQREGVRL